MVRPTITLQLIQLVALILPANVILLQVLTKVFEKPFDPRTQEFTTPLKPGEFPSGQRTQTDLILHSNTDRWQFYGPKTSLHLFVWAGMCFILSLWGLEYVGFVPLSPIILQNVGIVFLLIGFILMGAPLLAVEPTLLDALPKFRSAITQWNSSENQNQGEDTNDQ